MLLRGGWTGIEGKRIQSQSEQFVADRSTRMVPLVVAYGLRRDVTLMVRNMYFHRSFSTTDASLSGINDPYLLIKYKLYRKNTSSWVMGVAPHLAVNLPVGTAGIGSNTWNPDGGLNISFRPRFYSVDFSVNYRMMDVTVKTAGTQPDQFTANLAASHMIALNETGGVAVAPVVELNYFREVYTRDAGEIPGRLLLVSPGFSLITSAVVFESLVQFPLFQSTSGGGMQQDYRFIAGVKFMF